MLKPIAFLDMDASVADYDHAALRDMNELASPDEPPLINLMIDQNPPHLEARRHQVSSKPGWWRGLRPIPEGMALVQLFRDLGFRLVILTKGPRGKNFAWAEKKDWCDTHIPDADVIVTTVKDCMVGSVLYDDWPPYFEAWLETNPTGLVIMRDTPSNRGYSDPRVMRLTTHNLDVVKDCLLEHLSATG